ncbi:TonB-dependent receptor [Escherichia fergusonii]|nr:TonB-dependent receptor [Escherichia fergusonii]
MQIQVILCLAYKGEIRSRGFEIEAKAAVNANINVTAAYSYTDAEYTKDTLYKGKRPAEVPEIWLRCGLTTPSTKQLLVV